MADETPPPFLDFRVHFAAGDPAGYRVRVHSPAGCTETTVVLPTLPPGVQACFENLMHARRATRDFALPVDETQADADAAQVEAAGRVLFDALMTGEVATRYEECARKLRPRQGLRIRIAADAASHDVSAMPWELMYDAKKKEFVSQSRLTPVVRDVDYPRQVDRRAEPPALFSTDKPLRVLVMTASPEGMEQLDTDGERRRVEEALAELVAEGRVELVFVAGETFTDLQDKLHDPDWNVFHFIGHGGVDPEKMTGFVALTDGDTRAPRPLTATGLAHELNGQVDLRLVLLNCCKGAGSGEGISGTAAKLVAEGVPAVIAMQDDISDDAAKVFARTFYRAIAGDERTSIESAVASARRAVCNEFTETLEWATPALHLRATGHAEPGSVVRRVAARLAAGGRSAKIPTLLGVAILLAGSVFGGVWALRDGDDDPNPVLAFYEADPKCNGGGVGYATPEPAAPGSGMRMVYDDANWKGGLLPARQGDLPAYGKEWKALYSAGNECTEAQLLFDMPTQADDGATLTVCGLHDVGGGTSLAIEVAVNGIKLPATASPWQDNPPVNDVYVDPHPWRTASFAIPPDHLLPGQNAVNIRNAEPGFRGASLWRDHLQMSIGAPWILLGTAVIEPGAQGELGARACDLSPMEENPSPRRPA